MTTILPALGSLPNAGGLYSPSGTCCIKKGRPPAFGNGTYYPIQIPASRFLYLYWYVRNWTFNVNQDTINSGHGYTRPLSGTDTYTYTSETSVFYQPNQQTYNGNYIDRDYPTITSFIANGGFTGTLYCAWFFDTYQSIQTSNYTLYTDTTGGKEPTYNGPNTGSVEVAWIIDFGSGYTDGMYYWPYVKGGVGSLGIFGPGNYSYGNIYEGTQSFAVYPTPQCDTDMPLTVTFDQFSFQWYIGGWNPFGRAGNTCPPLSILDTPFDYAYFNTPTQINIQPADIRTG